MNGALHGAPHATKTFVNTIAIELPIALLTSDLRRHADAERQAVLGTYATTSRQQITVRRVPRESAGNQTSGPWRQVQRMGNPLVNELLIGTGSKDRFSMENPTNDGQFAPFFLRPLLADIFASIGAGHPLLGAVARHPRHVALAHAQRLGPHHQHLVAARQIVRAAAHRRAAVTPGWQARLQHTGNALAPELTAAALAAVAGHVLPGAAPGPTPSLPVSDLPLGWARLLISERTADAYNNAALTAKGSS